MRTDSLRSVARELNDYLFITFGVLCYAVGWNAFLVPYQITTGGVAGIASILYFVARIPMDISYFCINACFLLVALKVLGLKFMVKTIYSIVNMTVILRLLKIILTQTDGTLLHLMGPGENFMACVIGSGLCGIGLGFVFMHNGSTGGTDIIAAVVAKYKDIKLGRILTLCDIIIIGSCYFIFYDWRIVVFGFCTLFLTYYIMDFFMDSKRQSVQFFVVTHKYSEIAQAINNNVGRGCTLMEAEGSYTRQGTKVVMCLAHRSESAQIFDIIRNLDPDAFVSQSKVIGVFGNGFSALNRGNTTHSNN